MISSIILPMSIHIFWVAALYALLTIARAPNVWGIRLNEERYHSFNKMESKISANLSNQFEWPIFFYMICSILISNPTFINTFHILMAWIFVLGRILHSGVQLLSNNIRLRGVVFTINFLAVLGMWLAFTASVMIT